jgi:hypothetical protein
MSAADAGGGVVVRVTRGTAAEIETRFGYGFRHLVQKEGFDADADALVALVVFGNDTGRIEAMRDAVLALPDTRLSGVNQAHKRRSPVKTPGSAYARPGPEMQRLAPLIEAWIGERCRRDPRVTTLIRLLHRDFQSWADRRGVWGAGLKTFSMALKARGEFKAVKRVGRETRRGFRGIALLPEGCA